MLCNWLRNLAQSLVGRRNRRTRRQMVRRLGIESLESRVVPSTTITYQQGAIPNGDVNPYSSTTEVRIDSTAADDKPRPKFDDQYERILFHRRHQRGRPDVAESMGSDSFRQHLRQRPRTGTGRINHRLGNDQLLHRHVERHTDRQRVVADRRSVRRHSAADAFHRPRRTGTRSALKRRTRITAGQGR